MRIEIENCTGTEQISIHFNGDLSSILINQCALATSFYDHSHQGYLGNYFYKVNPHQEFTANILIAEFSAVLNEGNEEEIREIIPQLLLKFERGLYTVFSEGYSNLAQIVWTTRDSKDSLIHCDSGISDEIFNCTKYEKQLNKDTIEFYKDLILQGKRPRAISFQKNYEGDENTSKYLLDGHHKVKAYEELNIVPAIIDFFLYSNYEKGYEKIKESSLLFLNDRELEICIEGTPEIMLGQTEFEIRYNKILDYILSRGGLSSNLIEKLYLSVENKNEEYDSWRVDRLKAIKKEFQDINNPLRKKW